MIKRLLNAAIFLGCCAFGVIWKNGRERPVAEHIDGEERATAAKLVHAKDPVTEAIAMFQDQIRDDLNAQKFAELEKQSVELRTSKDLFANGVWKISAFYEALRCAEGAPDEMWEMRARALDQWLNSSPKSITAHVAYANFLTDYAWDARGSGYAKSVTEEGWQLFKERLSYAKNLLDDARELPDKDPVWWSVALRVARGQGWIKSAFDALVDEAHAFEPKFWEYDVARAYSLLPRWYGEPGDWETYVQQQSEREDGLGDQIYARAIIHLRPFHTNIFRESKASWERTRKGLEQLRAQYPEALEFVSHTAMLAAMANDRPLAQEMFQQLGETYLHSVWKMPERFAHFQKWAKTGMW